MLIKEVFGISDGKYTELAFVFLTGIPLNLSFFNCKLSDTLIVEFESVYLVFLKLYLHCRTL